MDLSLIKRIKELQKLREDFGLDQQKIGDYSTPKKSRETIARVLKANDERYITESNVEAIEKGVKAILAEYRRKLCVCGRCE